MDKQLHKVLLVDDEPQVLAGLQRQLHKLFEVHMADSGPKGLDILFEKGPFPVVVSDMRMPKMDGAVFLTKAKSMFPDTERILLTGHADVDAAISAVNDGQVFRFLVKPCAPELLIDTLYSAIERNERANVTRNMLADRWGLKEKNKHLQVLAMEDPLLNIGNRRAMERDFEHMHSGAMRYKRPYAMLMLDVDYFKQYNDHYGQPTGDKALQQVSSHVNECIRGSDRLYRYGGEEFVVILPETTIRGAVFLAERILREFSELSIPHEKSQYGHLSLSCGVAGFNPQDAKRDEGWQHVITNADQALYQAKTEGRNRVVCVE